MHSSKKILSCLALLLALALSLAACTPVAAPPAEPAETPAPPPAATPEPEPAKKFTAGVFQGTGQGHHGEIVVEATFTEDAISGISIVSESESLRVAEPALTLIPAEVVETQSLAVDTISTCTVTSVGVLMAITDAVTQAGGDVDAMRAPLPAPPRQADQTIEADVVIAGAGLAGMSAALAAVDSGKTVVVFEKNEIAGGSSALSGGFLLGVGTDMQKAVGYEETVDEYYDYWMVSTSPHSHEDLTDKAAIRAMIERSASDIQFLIDHGVGLHDPTGMGGAGNRWHYSDWREEYRLSMSSNGTPGGVDHVIRALEYLNTKPNFSIYYSSPVTELLTDASGKVSGVKAQAADGSVITVENAQSVVLATGGFGRSEELMKRFCPTFPTEWVNAYTTVGVGVTGDGIVMAEKLGADVYESGWWIDLALSVLPGNYTSPFNVSVRSANLIVDGAGERLYSTSASFGERSLRISDAMVATGAVWSIIDSTMAETAAMCEEYVDNVNVFKGETLEELATNAGMDPAVFAAAVERYNSMAEKGEDTDMGQAAARLIAIGDGPYYAASGKVTTMGSIGGLKTSDNGEVLNKEGTAIPGLFAAGEIMNGKYFNQVYSSGCSQLLCVDSGRIAGTNASK